MLKAIPLTNLNNKIHSTVANKYLTTVDCVLKITQERDTPKCEQQDSCPVYRGKSQESSHFAFNTNKHMYFFILPLKSVPFVRS